MRLMTVAIATASLLAAPPTASAAEPATEREAIVQQGKRLTTASYVLTGTSLVLTLTTITLNSRDQYNTAIGMGSAALVLAGGAVGLAIAGLRRTRHPEKFMREHQVTLAPSLTPRIGGVNVSLRF